MSDYTPNHGDRVRVVIEGEIIGPVAGNGTYFIGPSDGDGHAVAIHPQAAPLVVSVERIEPPYSDPEFVPGMVVRNADEPSDARRWSHEDGRRFLWINRPDAGYAVIRNRHQLPNRLAVAYDPRQDAP